MNDAEQGELSDALREWSVALQMLIVTLGNFEQHLNKNSQYRNELMGDSDGLSSALFTILSRHSVRVLKVPYREMRRARSDADLAEDAIEAIRGGYERLFSKSSPDGWIHFVIGIDTGTPLPWLRPSEQTHVILIVYTHTDSDLTGGNPDYDMGNLYLRLKKRFPQAQPIFLRARTSTETRESLLAVMSPDIVIDALAVLSHGESAIHDLIGKPIIYSILDNNEGFHVSIGDRLDVEKTFGPIVDRFGNDALLVFEGCATMRVGDIPLKFDFMKRVARNFGLYNGSIFMHRNDAVNISDTIMKQPFYTQPTRNRMWLALGVQLAASITYPVYWYQERMVYNKGFTLKVDQFQVSLYKDHYFNVLSDATPTGRSPLASGFIRYK